MAPFDQQGLSELLSHDPMKTALQGCKNLNEQKAVLTAFSLDYTQKELKEASNMSMRQVKNIRNKRKEHGFGGIVKKKKIRRNRLDLLKVEHFLEWMFETNILSEAAYGTSKVLFDSGQRENIPKAVLTMAKARAIKLYHDYCARSSFTPLSTSSCYRFLLKLKPSQRKAMAAMDNFLVECIEGFSILNGIIQDLSISTDIRKEISARVSLSEQYVRGQFIHKCSKSTNVRSHCIVCGISDPKQAEFKAICENIHDSQCSDCVNVVETLERIKKYLEDEPESHKKYLHSYDLNESKEKIIDYMKHCMRSKQQRQAKEYCKELCKENSFCAIWIADWGQKVLPMRYRESMQQYFARNGMSIHADCFMVYDQQEQQWKIHTYVTCINKCAQSLKDVVCVSDGVLCQFKKDKPNITKLFRKTDRAGCYTAAGYV